MPAAIDKEAMKLKIILACQKCAQTKPLPEVSLRDVAAELGVTHASLLYYFDGKDELLVGCAHWAGQEFCKMIINWFNHHKASEYQSNAEYFTDFIEYSIQGKSNKTLPRGVIMNCAMGEYSLTLQKAIQEESENIKNAIREGINNSDCNFDADLTETVLILLYGVYFCVFNHALPPKHIKNAILCMNQLLDSSK